MAPQIVLVGFPAEHILFWGVLTIFKAHIFRDCYCSLQFQFFLVSIFHVNSLVIFYFCKLFSLNLDIGSQKEVKPFVFSLPKIPEEEKRFLLHFKTSIYCLSSGIERRAEVVFQLFLVAILANL